MSKNKKLLESAQLWREKHADEAINLKALDAATTKLATAMLRSEEIKDKLRLANEQTRQLADILETTLQSIKAERKLARKTAQLQVDTKPVRQPPAPKAPERNPPQANPTAKPVAAKPAPKPAAKPATAKVQKTKPAPKLPGPDKK